jgi:hypothetical protein
MQKLAQKHPKKINLNLELFEQSIKSEFTRNVYIVCLKKYFQFLGSSNFVECDHTTDPRKVEKHIIDYIISLKKEGKSYSGIKNYVSAICKYYKVKDVYLNTSKISQFLPEFKKSKKDRRYRYEEIQKLLEIADERMRVVILLLASTGMRIGAIPDLRLGNIEFFSSQLVEAEPNVKPELRWRLEGHGLKANDTAYVKTTEKSLQHEYEKAIDNLTIDPANRLKRTVETLKIEKSKIDMLEAKIQKLERKYRR